MNLNETIAAAIDTQDAWRKKDGGPVWSLNDEIALGVTEAAAKLANAHRRGKGREEIEMRAANLIYGALLCAYRAGVTDIEGALERRVAELHREFAGE